MAGYLRRNIVDDDRLRVPTIAAAAQNLLPDPVASPILHVIPIDRNALHEPNTTACMMREGRKVNAPAIASAPTKRAIIALRCLSAA